MVQLLEFIDKCKNNLNFSEIMNILNIDMHQYMWLRY